MYAQNETTTILGESPADIPLNPLDDVKPPRAGTARHDTRVASMPTDTSI